MKFYNTIIFFKKNNYIKNIIIYLLIFFFIIFINKNLNFTYFFNNNWKYFIIIFLFFIFINLNNINKNYLLEEWLLNIIILFGSLVIILSNHFLILYLGLELQTFSFFILISKNKLWLKSSEAGIKYFFLGALSSGIFLLGIVILFIKGYSLYFQDFIIYFNYNNKILLYSLILIILSLFFKISLFPLHFWIPDIYEGSSWKTIGLISTLPKISIIYILIQLKFQDFFIICSLFSIIIGVLGGINQTKIKRLLAYSGITHIGFIILILSIINEKSFIITNIYLFNYVINILCILFIINKLYISKNNYIIELSNDKFLNNILGFSWVIIILSLAGIPPLSGFISKWLVIYNIIQENYIFSSIISILFSSLGVFYYIRIIKIIFFQKNSSFFMWNSIINNNKKLINNIYFFSLFIFFLLFFLLIIKFFLLFLTINFFYLN